ncbi:DNA repair protein RadA [bacterium]|nr:MAG: DNA repair protein RadA [bacterium]|tara:strand:- start:62 stop:1414 length:1353 start_codon:yes stop_codon:yes gene_type:complete
MPKIKTKTVYLCSSCGDDHPKWNGQCPSCNEWGTLSEFKVSKDRKIINQKSEKPIDLKSAYNTPQLERFLTKINEIDRVLGGGILPGSIILLGGNPGIGKSTLALQLLSKLKKISLYVSAEESKDQVAIRADRLLIDSSHVHISSENNIDYILDQCVQLKPSLLIIDSIQTIYNDRLDALPGSVSQIRECGQQLLQFAKQNNTSILIIGHVTKEGTIAGPKMLEHMVDTVLYLEGDDRQDHRILRSDKNRFGNTHEVGIFQMEVNGLTEVSNPSELFLSERQNKAPGSSIFPSVEGTRPILLEVQALVADSNFSTSQRNINGIDFKRLSMILAVLEKRLGLHLSKKDVFVNIVGGLKIEDPAIDLAVIGAIASSYKEKILNQAMAVFGEVGLGGEIRSVTKVENRINEAQSLGFSQIIIPKSNFDRLKRDSKSNVIGVSNVGEALHRMFL